MMHDKHCIKDVYVAQRIKRGRSMPIESDGVEVVHRKVIMKGVSIARDSDDHLNIQNLVIFL